MVIEIKHDRVPMWFLNAVEWLIARRGINFSALNYLSLASQRVHPPLLFHGTLDTLAPVTVSDAFAQSRPDLIPYQRVSGVDHVQVWNADSQAYEDALRAFLMQVSEGKEQLS